jgi:hypothetical protein
VAIALLLSSVTLREWSVLAVVIALASAVFVATRGRRLRMPTRERAAS